MKRYMVLGVILATIAASTPVEAQLRGLLRKKAEEAIGKKTEPAKPAPTAAPAPETPAPTPTSPATAPAATSPAPAPTAAARAAATDPVSPLDVSALPIRQAANQILRDDDEPRENGDWNQLPHIPAAATAAAYALGESARVALVETVGAALKTLVTSASFMTQHEEYIKRERKAVDHGLKGVLSADMAFKKGDMKSFEAIQRRWLVSRSVNDAQNMGADFAKKSLARELVQWKENAANVKSSDRAKYQKMVAKAESLETLTGDQFLRGYAVLHSIEKDGPDTEEALYALYRRVTEEEEQLAYDAFNLKGQLRRQLSTFVTIASKVNFDAPTAQKNGQIVFTNAADEKQGALWKACFRAGEGPTAAAVKLARAWLAEM